MTFLDPLTGALALAITGPALLVLYFLKLRRQPLRVSSTLLWQRAVQDLQVNSPFRMIRPSWMLLLQLAALLALAGAAGRPAINLDRAAGARAVVLIDRSASMNAADGLPARAGDAPSTRLEEAKRRAVQLVTSLRSRSAGDTRIMVVPFAATAAAATTLSGDLALLTEAIDSIAPSDQPGDLDGALAFLRTAGLQPAEESAPSTTVFLLTDGGPPVAPPREGESAPLPFLLRYIRAGPASSPETGFDNLAIVAMTARREFDDPGTVRVFLRLLNAAAEPRTASLRLELDGAPVAAETVTIPAATPEAPGEATSILRVVTSEGGNLTAALAPADLLPADNAAAVVLPSADRADVVVVAPRGAGGAPEPDRFILGALQAFEPGSLAVLAPEDYARALAEGATAGAGPLAQTDLLIFDRTEPATLPAVPSLSFAAGLPTLGVRVAPLPQERRGESSRFIAWNRNHPMLRGVPLDSVVVAPPMQVETAAPDDGGPAPEVETLVEGARGPLVVLARDGAVRRAVVGFDVFQSNWGPQVSFPTFMTLAIEHLALRAESRTGRFLLTTQPVTVRPAPGADRIEVRGPAGVVASAALPAGDNALRSRGPVSLGVVERAGLYAVAGAAEADASLAVNLFAPSESVLRTADQIEVSGQAIAAAGSVGDVPREVWHWFVAAALALLTVEWFAYAWRMRL